MCYFFFFKQKTAYEMRISDWSSDVCSSDLEHVVVDQLVVAQRLAGGVEALEDLLCIRPRAEGDRHVLEPLEAAPDPRGLVEAHLTAEERIVVVEPRVALVPFSVAVEDQGLEPRRPPAMGARSHRRRVGKAGAMMCQS